MTSPSNVDFDFSYYEEPTYMNENMCRKSKYCQSDCNLSSEIPRVSSGTRFSVGKTDSVVLTTLLASQPHRQTVIQVNPADVVLSQDWLDE
jgi:hypothetical protein